jgi:hypothetical protein
MCLTLWVHESGRIGHGSNYRMYGRWEIFFSLDVHEDKIVELALWTCGFGALCVCLYDTLYDDATIV